jgi:hypothetical protein
VIARREIRIKPGAPGAVQTPGMVPIAGLPQATLPDDPSKLALPTSTVTSVSFDHPASVAAKSNVFVKLKVKGEMGLADTLDLVRPGDGKPLFSIPAISSGFPLPAPDKPGTYELRYVARSDLRSTKIVGTSTLRVTAAKPISVDSPASAVAGSTFEVKVHGSPGMGSVIVVVPPGAKINDFTSMKVVTNMGIGPVVPGQAKTQVVAPRAPGNYELRLMSIDRSSKKGAFLIEARKPIKITAK